MQDKYKKCSQEERVWIDKAKQFLIETNHMTEQEAFRYIQKYSMDSCMDMGKIAQKI